MVNDDERKSQDSETQFIKKDFYKSVFINTFFLALLIALYLVNKRLDLLDRLVRYF